jgi:hypothetical protein
MCTGNVQSKPKIMTKTDNDSAISKLLEPENSQLFYDLIKNITISKGVDWDSLAPIKQLEISSAFMNNLQSLLTDSMKIAGKDIQKTLLRLSNPKLTKPDQEDMDKLDLWLNMNFDVFVDNILEN